MHKEIDSFDRQPLISIILPSYKPQMTWFKQAIESVYEQTYQNWELCIADDASNLPELNQYLKVLQSEDTRVKVVFRKDNGHISAASNSALALATGEWVALLDHDDLLHEYALFYLAKEILTHSDAVLIYSDEDKVDEHSVRHDPYFKPDWNLELFYSQNMFSHLGAYKKQLLDDIGGFRVGLEGAQDYDLALRCIERVNADKIRHIPRVLYHWRVHDKSTSKDPDAKPYAMLAGERALNEHFRRTGQAASAELIGFGYRVRYDLPVELPMVTVIIPTKNNHELLQCCLNSIFSLTTYSNYEIIIIDNGSDSLGSLNYFDEIMSMDRVRILTDSQPFNYSALNNGAVEVARGTVICLLNNDTEIITAGWLSEMVGIAIRPDVGAVGAKLLYSDGSIQHAGIICGMGIDKVAGHAHYRTHSTHNGYFGRSNLTSSFSAVTGACMVLRKSLYKKVLGMNEVNLSVAYNDVDLCLKIASLGYRNIYTPYAKLYHHESASRGRDSVTSDQQRFSSEVEYMRAQWSEILQEDAMYSPNLSLDHSDFRYAYPPRVAL
ncbi:MAG: glycosyltransferase family 2 protein [Halioglobus sp.]|nr:glycosyltransferase family 2 protein [Halioglobus sp.]